MDGRLKVFILIAVLLVAAVLIGMSYFMLDFKLKQDGKTASSQQPAGETAAKPAQTQMIDPAERVKACFQTALPASAKVVSYRYVSSEGFLACKFSIIERDIPALTKGYDVYFHGEAYDQNHALKQPEHFETSIPWWDVSYDHILHLYIAPGTGTEAKPAYAIITKNADGQYYLYTVCYTWLSGTK